MPERDPVHDPGHLDIDAVSAYVDRDFGTADLTAIEFHLHQCPACDREVLEIRATVLLLNGLPQYTPRRSFLLSHEHARAARRRDRAPGEQGWLPPALTAGQQPAALPAGATRNGGWLAGMQVAAMIVGALLLLVTAGDLSGVVPADPDAMQLAAPTAAAELPEPEATVQAPQAAVPETVADQAAAPAPAEEEPAFDGVSEQAPDAFETAFQQAPSTSRGTEREERASVQMPADADAVAPAPRAAATSAVAAVTQAIPTPGAANEPAGAAPASESAAPTAESGEQPSRLRIVQLALGLLLAWLVVSIAGMRWVRRLR